MNNQKEQEGDKTNSRKIVIKIKKKPDSSSSTGTQSTADNQPQESPVIMIDGDSTDESIRSLDRLQRVKQPAKLSDLKRRNMNTTFASCPSEAMPFISAESDSDTDSSGRPVKKRSLVDIYRSCKRID